MKPGINLFASFACTLLLPLKLMAGVCDAYFPFDGNVADAGSNGLDGQVIVKGGGPAVRGVQFAPGRNGQALRLTGQTAVAHPWI